MEQVVLVIHLMLALAIIGLVLLQRSEGGGLGIGSSGGMGGLATPGGAASALTKVTAFMAFCFFGTSLFLGILAGKHGNANTILDDLDKAAAIKVVDDEGNAEEVEITIPDLDEKPSVPLD